MFTLRGSKYSKSEHLKCILDLSSARADDGIFILGQLGQRVTFASQQTRACNLIIALRELKLLKSGANLCVVGGGLAGLTAAALAHEFGAQVDVIEQGSRVLSLQSGNFVRYIHPNLLDWPQTSSLEKKTSLPVLNWEADICEAVVRQIEAKWDSLYAHHVRIRPLTQVTAIKSCDGYVAITVKDRKTNQENIENYKVVILATGFGLEKRYDGVEFLSYWSNDKLHQEAFENKPYLVSGTGDGGLIDALRLRLQNFDHTEFVDRYFSGIVDTGLGEKLLDIENTLINSASAGNYVVDAYNAIYDDVPIFYKNSLLENLRRDVQIILNGNLSHPADPQASALNRFTAYILWKEEEIQYKQGRLKSISGRPGAYDVNFHLQDDEWTIRSVGALILRHGPRGTLKNLLPAAAYDTLLKSWRDKSEDLTLVPLWNNVEDLCLRRPAPAVSQRLVAKNHLMELVAELGRHRVLSAEVSRSPDSVHYSVLLSTISIPNNSPIEFRGIPVYYSLSDPKKIKPSIVSRPTYAFLTYGSPLGLDKSGWCSLGCFVSFPENGIGFLTTSHLQRGNIPLAVGEKLCSAPRLGSDNLWQVGVVAGIAALTASTAERIMLNRIDVSVSRMIPDVRYQPAFPQHLEIDRLAPYCEEPQVGDSVFKIGAATGITFGKITKIELYVGLRPHGNEVWMTGMFEIEGIDGGIFSAPGDSGAIVFKKNETGEVIALGMLFGAYSLSSIAFPLDPALRYLDCRIFVGC